jgi:hypothetical protein
MPNYFDSIEKLEIKFKIRCSNLTANERYNLSLLSYDAEYEYYKYPQSLKIINKSNLNNLHIVKYKNKKIIDENVDYNFNLFFEQTAMIEYIIYNLGKSTKYIYEKYFINSSKYNYIVRYVVDYCLNHKFINRYDIINYNIPDNIKKIVSEYNSKFENGILSIAVDTDENLLNLINQLPDKNHKVYVFKNGTFAYDFGRIKKLQNIV